jgi:hypothetical protein
VEMLEGMELLYNRFISTPVPPPPISRDTTRDASTPVPPSSR